MSIFLIIVIGVGWGLSWYFGMIEILYIAVGIAVVQSAVSYWRSDKIALSLNNAKQIEKSDNPELWNITENLAITAGLPMPRLYIMDEPAPNAFATGRNPEHSAIAVTSGLLHILDRTELEGVIAHEMSHIGNRDILVMSVTVVLVGVLTLVADLFLRFTIFGGRGRDSRDGGGAIMLVVGIVMLIVAPIAGLIIKSAISRKREFLADASGALLTRYPEGLANALRKISSYAGKMRKANHATAHMFISNPFGAKGRKGFNKLFATHPPMEERVEQLRVKG